MKKRCILFTLLVAMILGGCVNQEERLEDNRVVYENDISNVSSENQIIVHNFTTSYNSMENAPYGADDVTSATLLDK